MSRMVEAMVKVAVRDFVTVSNDLLDMKIKDSIPQRVAWEGFSRRFCGVLRERGFRVPENEIDALWEGNKVIGDIIIYIEGYQPINLRKCPMGHVTECNPCEEHGVPTVGYFDN